MLLTLTRDVFGADATLGALTVDGKPFGFCVEDEDRGLDAADPDTIVRKVKRETAIPVGRYRIKRTWSPKYQRDVMQLLDVPGFRGIRVHTGNDESHTEGCLLPGLVRNVEKMTVARSRPAVAWLDKQVAACATRDEEVWIEVRRDPAAWAAVRRVA